jgi:hypothetical protein
MYNQQHDWTPDHVQDFIQERFEKDPSATMAFTFDDAFSDADDSDPKYAFSSVVIRADLAQAVSYSQEGKPRGAEESSGVDATGEPLPGPSLSVFGFLVTLREPHHSVGILLAPLSTLTISMPNSTPFLFRRVQLRNHLMRKIIMTYKRSPKSRTMCANNDAPGTTAHRRHNIVQFMLRILTLTQLPRMQPRSRHIHPLLSLNFRPIRQPRRKSQRGRRDR